MGNRKPPVLVLANPKAGGGLAGELVPHLARDLSELGYPVDVFQSAGPGNITEKVRTLAGTWTALAVVGGDGTVREALMGEPAAEMPIAVLPAGTANVLATEFRLPRAPRDTARMIEAGAARTIDTGFVVREGKAPEPFVLFVGAGADAEIVHRVHEKRAGGTLGKLRYIAPILSQLFSYKPVEHWFVLENGDRHGPFEQVIVTNVTSYGSMWKLPGRITPDDGLLDCIGFRAKTALQLLRHGVAGSFNRLRESNKLQTWQAARVRIESESTSRVQVDGDPLGECPVDIEVRPLSLRLLVPGEPTT